MILHSPSPRSRFALRGIPTLGPDRLAVELAKRLDDSYHYVRHAAAAGLELVDAVVVGPGGTWTLTQANQRGRFHKRNGHWYRWNGSTDSWIPWDAHMITVARLAGHRLELALERAGLPSTVEACLVTSREAVVDWEENQRPGIHVHDNLDKLARRMGRDETLSDAQVERIVALLDPRQPLPRLAPSAPRG
jgi:hypothetical protein